MGWGRLNVLFHKSVISDNVQYCKGLFLTEIQIHFYLVGHKWLVTCKYWPILYLFNQVFSEFLVALSLYIYLLLEFLSGLWYLMNFLITNQLKIFGKFLYIYMTILLPFQKNISKGSWTWEILTPDWAVRREERDETRHMVFGNFMIFHRFLAIPPRIRRKQLSRIQEHTAWELRKTKVTIKQIALA